MDVCCMYVCVQHMCLVPTQPIRSMELGTGVIEGCELPYVCQNLTMVCYKSSKCSQEGCHLSSTWMRVLCLYLYSRALLLAYEVQGFVKSPVITTLLSQMWTLLSSLSPTFLLSTNLVLLFSSSFTTATNPCLAAQTIFDIL